LIAAAAFVRRFNSRLPALAAALLACLITIQCSGGNGGNGSPTGPTVPGPPNPNPNPIPSGPETFVGAGDIAICGGNAEATAKLLDSIGGTVFTLGDNAYSSGTRADFQNCYDPSWGRHRSRTRPSPGNHDYATPGAAPYFEYFGANAGAPGVGYYSFDLGAWHIISLNSNVATDAGSPQAAWLRADLAANAAPRCTLAYWHHPLFSSGPNGSRETPVMREIYRILYNASADLVLVGHDHTYERFAPQDADGRLDPLRGIRQFVVGTGGVPLYDFPAIQPNSEVRLKAHGVMRLILSSDRYQWDFLAVSGAGDSGTTPCH
jgi:acid phosphatase type 7